MGWRRPLNARRFRAARLVGLGLAMTAATVAATFLLLPLAVRGLVRALEFTLNACIWIAAALGTGADAWTIVGTVGRAAGRALLTTEALAVTGGLVLVGGVALYALQRLLGFEEESSR